VPPQDSLTLRRANAKDADFAFRVLKETMREYVVATWGTWREDESRRETVEQVSSGRTEVIELNGVPIGVQLVERPGTHIQLVQLYIAKEFQRRGFGTQLVNDCCWRQAVRSYLFACECWRSIQRGRCTSAWGFSWLRARRRGVLWSGCLELYALLHASHSPAFNAARRPRYSHFVPHCAAHYAARRRRFPVKYVEKTSHPELVAQCRFVFEVQEVRFKAV
jgi:GNAT superfamily N-acetyltransferase